MLGIVLGTGDTEANIAVSNLMKLVCLKLEIINESAYHNSGMWLKITKFLQNYQWKN